MTPQKNASNQRVTARTVNATQPRGVSGLMVLLFGAIIVLPSLLQIGVEWSSRRPIRAAELFERVPTVENLRAYEQRLEDASVVGKVVRAKFQSVQFRLFRDLGDQVVEGYDGWLFYRPGIDALTQRIDLAAPDSVDAASAIIGFRDQLRSRGIHLLVLPIPNKESIYPEQLSRRASRQSVAVVKSTEQLLDRLRSAEVELVDLFAAFGQAKQRSDETADLYLVQDTHWSPAGVEQTAQLVAERLLKNGWIQRGQVKYDRQPTTVRRVGDLLEMLQVPAIERAYGREAVECVKIVERESQQAYENDPRSQVLVLGDSFSRIYQQDEPGQAGWIAHLAARLQQPLAAIVNDGGAATLVRQQLARQPQLLEGKKVVIWEFVERDLRQAIDGWQSIDLELEY